MAMTVEKAFSQKEVYGQLSQRLLTVKMVLSGDLIDKQRPTIAGEDVHNGRDGLAWGRERQLMEFHHHLAREKRKATMKLESV